VAETSFHVVSCRFSGLTLRLDLLLVIAPVQSAATITARLAVAGQIHQREVLGVPERFGLPRDR
jgi:hypothetical protein